MSTKTSVKILVSLAVFCAFAQAAAAQTRQPKLRLGTLTCTGQGSLGLIFGSKQHLECQFKPADGGPSDSYEATITKLGLDVGIEGKSILAWEVLSSTTKRRDRFISGTYVGAAADASVGIGGGANLLVGGNRRSVTLQPLSVQAQTGLNLAVGVAELKIR